MHMLLLRIGINSILAGAVLFAPWWVALAGGIVGFAAFPLFFELVAWTFVAELLYGTPIAGISFPATIAVFLGVCAGERVKMSMRL